MRPQQTDVAARLAADWMGLRVSAAIRWKVFDSRHSGGGTARVCAEVQLAKARADVAALHSLANAAKMLGARRTWAYRPSQRGRRAGMWCGIRQNPDIKTGLCHSPRHKPINEAGICHPRRHKPINEAGICRSGRHNHGPRPRRHPQPTSPGLPVDKSLRQPPRIPDRGYNGRMPRIIDYSIRFECIREAVFDITLRDGAAGITLAAVGRELKMSETTLRRLVANPARLPELGLQWAERAARTSWYAHRSGRFRGDDPVSVAANDLLRLVPGDEDAKDVAQAKRLLTRAHPGEAWALTSVRNDQLSIALAVERIVPAELEIDDRQYESVRLTALVTGVTEAVCTGAILPPEAADTVVRHLSSTFPAWLSDPRPGAA